MAEKATLGPHDEPQNSGAIVAVHWGDYRSQLIFVRSGSNIGCWYCLGNEFGVPRTWVDPRTSAEKLRAGLRDPVPQPGPGEIPLHPHWEDVLKRGPVTLLTPGDPDTYAAGWANGRRRMAEQVEELSYDDPEGTA